MRIGITGECGSGKSFICKIFEAMGISVYNCDNGSKQLVIGNQELVAEIKAEFGENIYEGNVYKNLANIVFIEGSEERLEKLTSLIHPYIDKDINEFYTQHQAEKFCLIETATLYEVGMEKSCDRVIYVCVSEATRMERARIRSGFSEQDYKNRMKKQISPIIKIRKSDYIIQNDISDNINEQIQQVYNHLTHHDPEKYVAKKWLDEYYEKYLK